MFGDFSSLIVDQLLNGSVKFRDMFGGQIECPIKIRLPMGAGGGYGPTHSQSIEKIFMAIDGLEIVALNRLIDPIMVYENILNSKNPSMILEHKSDYKKKFDLSASTLNEFYISNENFPTILCKYKNKEPTITIYTYGANVETALDLQKQLFINEEKFAQVVVFSKLSNIALEMLEITTLNISDVIIIEDGTPKHGFGSEIIANLAADLKRNLNFRRMGAKHHIIPACYELEQKVLVSAKDYWGK
jgi:2-oxoisovalerate dehydrogenase E1 component